MKVIGITGGICSGKSTISAILQKNHGATILDADKFGHQAYQQQTDCYRQLVAHFGKQIVAEDTGDINRKVLGSIVFADPAQMRALEQIVWPEILKLLNVELSRIEPTCSLAVVEAAIMIEANWHTQLPLDVLWVVQVPPAVAKERLMVRNSLSSEDADKRIASQMTNEERAKHAQYVLDNVGDQEQLAWETKRLLEASMSTSK